MHSGPNDDSQINKIRLDSHEISAATESTDETSAFNELKSFTESEVADIKAWILREKQAAPNEPILCIAATQGREDVMRWLLQNGNTDAAHLLGLSEGQRLYVNARDKQDRAPLHWAAKSGRIGIVRFLLALPEDQRADVNPRDNEFSTPLHLAARYGHTDIVRFLLALPEGQRPEVDARDNEFSTPLHLAAENDHIDIVRFLLELPEGQRPDVNARDIRSWTPLHVAASLGHTDIVRFLLGLPEGQRPVLNARGNEDFTPIMLAFEQGNHEIVTLLQQYGAELPARLRPDAPPGAAAAVINDRQSIHTTFIHESVSSSATALLKRYKAEDINAARELLFAWVNAQAGDKSNIFDKTEAAKRCVGNYGTKDFTDPRSGVTLSQAFGLVWLGVNDANAIEDKTLTDEDINSRRQTLLIDHLYRMQRGYNLNDKEQDNGQPDNSICIAGSFSTLINTLARAHKEVTFIFVNAASVSLKAEAVLKSYIKSLTPEEKTTFAKKDCSENEILPQTLFNKLKEYLQAELEDAFGDCKGLLANYDTVVTEFLNHLEFHPKIAALSSELTKLRQVNGTVSEIEIDLSPPPGYFPSVNDEAEEQAPAPANPVMTPTFTPISARRMGR